MQGVRSILEEIPSLQNIKEALYVEKGFSQDDKWVLETDEGPRLFIKVCDEKVADHKEEEFRYMRHFYDKGIPLPEPKQFERLSHHNKCVQVFGYVSGQDAEVALPLLPEATQYEVGVQAGEVLRDIHKLHKEKPSETWEEYRWAKYQRYNNALEEMKDDIPHTFSMDPVISFVQEHKHLLKNRPVVFMHDDYHPGNMMVGDGQFNAVIDFDRFEWGDPYHDFYKMALFTRNVSIPFAIGQLHGYFDGEPPMKFWQHYALYVAMIFHSDIVWSIRIGGKQPEQSHKRLTQMLKDHEGFTRYIPTWYDNSF
ncbi:phosphotransferase [Pontibacillus sp. HMF3514]|nr:phosphotransferase [Pontibacillus sp. HMF3514]